ncbi:MAG: SGNH/GDSL hydrolase family protein [Bacteroidia bacterium]
MKKFKKPVRRSAMVILGTIAFAACKPTLNAPSPSKGSINPTTYVAIGNSITSGYADNALYYDGQKVSYPFLISEQLKLVGGGDFSQPLMSAGSPGIGSAGNSRFVLGHLTDCLGVSNLMPVPFASSGDAAALSMNIYNTQGPFNNMGVPGAKSFHVLAPGYGHASGGNPFFYRMASNPATTSIIADALAQNPTFFSVFIGNNDVLAYAMNGGASDSITSPSLFSSCINNIVNALSANGAKGVIGNIPDIINLPYFTTIPWNGLTLRQGQADTLNADMPNGTGGSLYNFQAGNNAFVIADPSVPFLFKRQILPGEYILLNTPLDSIKCHYLGTLIPIPNCHVLTRAEVANIEAAISNFNMTIQAAATSKGLAFVDVNTFMNKTNKGIVYDGMALNTAFVSGGAFSLDGIHLNPIGNALLANEFLKSMNATFGSTLPLVDATRYRGVIFP